MVLTNNEKDEIFKFPLGTIDTFLQDEANSFILEIRGDKEIYFCKTVINILSRISRYDDPEYFVTSRKELVEYGENDKCR
jgi:hypothetical protein